MKLPRIASPRVGQLLSEGAYAPCISGTSLTVLFRPLALYLGPGFVYRSGLCCIFASFHWVKLIASTLTGEYDPRPRDWTAPVFFYVECSVYHAGAQDSAVDAMPGHPTVKHALLQAVACPLCHMSWCNSEPIWARVRCQLGDPPH